MTIGSSAIPPIALGVAHSLSHITLFVSRITKFKNGKPPRLVSLRHNRFLISITANVENLNGQRQMMECNLGQRADSGEILVRAARNPVRPFYIRDSSVDVMHSLHSRLGHNSKTES